MIMGIICAACILLLLAYHFLKKSGSAAVKKLFGRLHRLLGYSVIIIVVFHVISTKDVWDKRHNIVIITGIITGILIIAMLISCLLFKNNRKKFVKSHRIFALLIFTGLLFHIGSALADFNAYRQQIKHTYIEGMNAAGIDNGSYIGEYNTGYIFTKVEVIIENEEIRHIEILEHRNERGNAAERIIDDVIGKQTTAVDTISGATNSSLVILKAVENAIQGDTAP